MSIGCYADGVSGKVSHLLLNVAKGEPLKPVPEALGVARFGFEGDRHFKEDADDQLLLIEEETLQEFEVPIGALRENLVTQGIEIQSLPFGTRLRVGEALLQLTRECAPCKMLNEIRPGLLKQMAGRRGFYARVVEGGTVRVGDAVREQSA